MARVGRAFRFDGRPSAARSWDIRFRVAATAVLSGCVLAAPTPSLVALAALVLVLLALASSTAGEAARVVRGFSGFLVFFVGLGLLFEPTLAQAAFLGTQAARLTLLLLLGHFLFLAATPSDVTEGMRWYLGFLGKRRAWAAASMAGWALGSVPLVLDQAAGLLDAAALRGLTPRRHPLRTLKLLTLGLLVRTVGRSFDLASALEARGFGREVPPLRLRARVRDAAAFGAVVASAAASWAVGSILTP
jgi:energy-coupling factor transporter transmembrane protein EcfT